VLLSVAAGLASAQTTGDVQRALADARASAAVAAARAARLEAAAASARDDAARARATSAAVAARIQSAEADIIAAEARIAFVERLRRAQRARLAAQQGPTIRLVAAVQSLARRPAALAIVQPGSLDDMVHVQAALSAVLPVVDQRTSGLRAEVTRGQALAQEADNALRRLKSDQARLIDQRRQLAALAIERRRAASAFDGSAMAEQDRAIALGEEARDLGDLVRRIDGDAQQRARLATLPGPVMRPLRPGAAASQPTPQIVREAPQARYRLPVIGQVLTGMGEVSTTGIRARGLTIATRPSAQVVAPTGGRVAFAGPYRGFGNIVIIDHGRGWTTLITSLAALDVRVGDALDPGSPIGRAGASRPTITVELRRDGQPVDIARVVG